MRKVLFIYYMFPPLVGGWRAIASFVRYLPDFGWQPIVLSAAESVRYDKDYSLLEEVPDSLVIHRVGHPEPSRWWQFARNHLGINTDFPDYYKTWYTPALEEGRKILQSQKVDLIFSYAPPHTCHFVAMQLKKEFGIPWVADSEDPWSGNEFLNDQYKKILIKPLRIFQKARIRRAEKNILTNTDGIIVVSWYHQQQLYEFHGVKKENINVLNNGYDEFDFKELTPYSFYPDRLKIIFLGTFYPQFEESFRTFAEAVNEVAEDGEIIMLGRGTPPPQSKNLTRILYVPKEKALNFCFGSDFLLVIMPPTAKWIPMKTYDYLRLGKPILALVPNDGDPARIVREAKAGFVLSFDKEQMKQQLKAIFDEWRSGELKEFQPNQEYIAQFERRRLTKHITQVFDIVSR